MSTIGRASVLVLLALAGCSSEQSVEIESLRQAVADHTQAVRSAASTEQARSETDRYASSTLAATQELNTRWSSCSMMDPQRMQQGMGALSTAISQHREAMLRLQNLGAMASEAVQHAASMTKVVDDLEAEYRACNCDHMM